MTDLYAFERSWTWLDCFRKCMSEIFACLFVCNTNFVGALFQELQWEIGQKFIWSSVVMWTDVEYCFANVPQDGVPQIVDRKNCCFFYHFGKIICKNGKKKEIVCQKWVFNSIAYCFEWGSIHIFSFFCLYKKKELNSWKISNSVIQLIYTVWKVLNMTWLF